MYSRCIFLKAGISGCPVKVYATNLCGGTCLSVSMCRCMPQHMYGGQRANRILFSAMWELRIGLSLHISKHWAIMPQTPVWFLFGESWLGTSIFRTLASSVIVYEYGNFEALLLFSARPVCWELLPAELLSLTVASMSWSQTETSSSILESCPP